MGSKICINHIIFFVTLPVYEDQCLVMSLCIALSRLSAIQSDIETVHGKGITSDIVRDQTVQTISDGLPSLTDDI